MLDYPDFKKKFFYNGNVVIDFKWKFSPDIGEPLLEISKNPDFTSLLLEHPAQNLKYKSLDLIPGEYFWRISGTSTSSGEDEYSEERNFEVISIVPPVLTSPSFKKIISYKESLDSDKKISTGAVVNFGWVVNPYAENYSLQISRDEQFQTLYFDKQTSSNYFNVSSFSKGEYYWRVKTNIIGVSNSEFSDVSQFKIRKLDLPDPPTILRPTDNYQFNITNSNPRIQLKWNDVSGAESYYLEISKNKEFSHPMVQKHMVMPEFLWKPPERGIYFWRIRSDDVFSRKTKYSVTQQLAVRLIAPLLRGPKEDSFFRMNKKRESIIFKWKENTYFSSYVFEMSKGKDFNKIEFDLKTKFSVFEWDDPPTGVYFWRIRAITNNADPPLISKSRKINIIRPPPKPKSPRGTLVYYGAERDLVFKWRPIPKVVSYVLEVSKGPEFVNPVSEVTSKSSIKLSGWKQGIYYWRVKAIDSHGESTAYSDLMRLSVQKRNPLMGPEILAPQIGAEYTYEKEFPTIGLQWEENRKAKNYQIQISRDPAFVTKEIVKKTTDPTFIVSLEEGEYYWRTRGVDNQSVAGKWSDSSSFKVTKKSLRLKKIIRPPPKPIKFPNRWFSFSYSPILGSYVLSNSTSKIAYSGLFPASVEISYIQWFNKKYGMDAYIKYTSFTAFQNNTFNNIDLSDNQFGVLGLYKFITRPGKNKWSISAGTGLSLEQVPIFTSSGQPQISITSGNTTNLRLGLHYQGLRGTKGLLSGKLYYKYPLDSQAFQIKSGYNIGLAVNYYYDFFPDWLTGVGYEWDFMNYVITIDSNGLESTLQRSNNFFKFILGKPF